MFDVIAISNRLANGSATLWATLELDLQFLRGGVRVFHPLIKAFNFKEMLTVLKLYESGIFIVLSSKIDGLDFFLITYAALGWALFSTQTNTRMATALDDLCTRFVALFTITELATRFVTFLVRTVPLARLHTGVTGFITSFGAVTVEAVIIAGLHAGWAC